MADKITENTPVILWDCTGTLMAQWLGYKVPEWLGTILTAKHDLRHDVFPNLNASAPYFISWNGSRKMPLSAGLPLVIALQMELINRAELRH